MIRLLWTEIDLDVIAQNMQIIRKMAKSKEVAAVIKADAYGHGSVTLAKTLLENGADRLAVARLDEGLELRHQGIIAPIFILGYTNPVRASEAIAYGIDVCIFDYEQARLFSEEAVKQQSEVVFHIAIDSGMQRIGYQPTKEAVEEIVKISKLPNVKIEGMFTHFCLADCADKTFTHTQYKRFKWVCDEAGIRQTLRSISLQVSGCGTGGNLAKTTDRTRLRRDIGSPFLGIPSVPATGTGHRGRGT